MVFGEGKRWFKNKKWFLVKAKDGSKIKNGFW
jgi:hypothetical protein